MGKLQKYQATQPIFYFWLGCNWVSASAPVPESALLPKDVLAVIESREGVTLSCERPIQAILWAVTSLQLVLGAGGLWEMANATCWKLTPWTVRLARSGEVKIVGKNAWRRLHSRGLR